MRFPPICVAALAAFCLAVPAVSGELKPDGAAQVDNPLRTDAGTDSDVDGGATASIDEEASFKDAISAVEGGTAAASSIRSMSRVSKVDVVRIGDLAEGEEGNRAALDRVVEQNRAAIETLRASIAGNESLKA